LILGHYTGLFTNKTRNKRKITKKFKLLFISLEASVIRSLPLSKPFPNRRRAPEPNSTKWRPQRRAYCSESAEYTASQAHRPTPVPTTHPSFTPLGTQAMLKFLPKIIFFEINRVNNIIT
jgi:hypothetical protein